MSAARRTNFVFETDDDASNDVAADSDAFLLLSVLPQRCCGQDCVVSKSLVNQECIEDMTKRMMGS